MLYIIVLTSSELYKMWGAYGDEDAEVGLLGCNVLWTYM